MNIEKSATKLSKNPLGIIALFILLIYGLATTLFGYAGNTLTDGQKWWFVVFLVIFPIIVLASFVYLVVNHHPKLYAPSDFRDEKNFFGQASKKEREEKYKQEEFATYSDKGQAKNTNSSASFMVKMKQIEQIVYDYYERIFHFDIEKHVYFNIDGKRYIFDGISEKNGYLNIFEIKYVRSSLFPKALLHTTIENAVKVKNFMLHNEKYNNYTFKLIFVIVVDSTNEEVLEKVENIAHGLAFSKDINVSIRIFSTAQLEKKVKSAS